MDDQPVIPFFNRTQVAQCINEMLTSNGSRATKRKHRRHHLTNEKDKINNPSTSYDRSNPAEILQYFSLMKMKVDRLYDELQRATALGKVREVLKIEEKLKLLRPYSARFIADENMPDGTLINPNEKFRKGWIVFNDGSLPWDPEDIQLINLSDGIQLISKPNIPVTAPHDKALITIDFIAPSQSGIYESKWILSYRQQTFGPMFWCSIEVRSSQSVDVAFRQSSISSSSLEETFEFVDVPLPDCFDLSKPFRPRSMFSSCRASTTSESDEFPSADEDFLMSNKTKSLIDLEDCSSSSSSSSESAVNSILSVSNEIQEAVKPVVNLTQTMEDIRVSTVEKSEEKASLINTFNSEQHQDNIIPILVPQMERKVNRWTRSTDPMTKLIEMGFSNRAKNQRLLRENYDDLDKVVELLTLDSSEDPDWFNHRH